MNPGEKTGIELPIGVILLLLNPVFGWGSVLIAIFLAKKTAKRIYIYLGTACYLLSWVMAGAGVWLAGETGKKMLVELFAEYGIESAVLPALLSSWAVIYFIIGSRGIQSAAKEG